MKQRNFIRAVIGFIMLCVIYFLINMIDLAIVYTIFLSFQFLLAPMFIAFGYFVAVIRLSLPYILMYILICIFINLPYRKNYTIKFLKYSIDIKAAQNTKIYIYLSQYNYIIIFSINFLILFIIYYSYINNKYFNLFFYLDHNKNKTLFIKKCKLTSKEGSYVCKYNISSFSWSIYKYVFRRFTYK